jgi:hypothetical protein
MRRTTQFHSKTPVRLASILVLAASLSAALVSPAGATQAADEREVLFPAAVEDQVNDTVALKVKPAWVASTGTWAKYVVTESSNRRDAARRGVNWSPKLKNARGTDAVQTGRYVNGVLVVEAGVDFAPTRIVVPGPGGFPPAQAEPGAIGDEGYSPLVRLPSGVVINAPQIANETGRADKLLRYEGRRAVFQETEGFYEGKDVYYVSFDSSDPGIAALEGVTYAPALNAAPGRGSNDDDSARSGIAPFVNGQTGVDNRNRQGLNSALLGEGDPLNIVQTLADDNDYSPLWDVHATQWSSAAKASGADVVQTDFDDLGALVDDGLVTGPDGAAWGAIGVIVNCPEISVGE